MSRKNIQDTNQHMFSRCGKSTNSQFLAFSANINNLRYGRTDIDEEDESEFGDTGLDGDFKEKKEINKKYIANQMKRISDGEKLS